MSVDDTLMQIVGIAVVLAVFLAFVAYLMAAYGEFSDTNFGLAVQFATIVGGLLVWLGLWLAEKLAPGLTSVPEAVMVWLAVIALAGILGAALDIIAWFTGR
jgi:hypothetical protein